MAETSSLAEFFLHTNVIFKLLTRNCKTNLSGNACATENIAINFTIFVIFFIGRNNLYSRNKIYSSITTSY